MPTIQHLLNLKSPADSSQQSVMSEAQEAAAAEKKPAAKKTESSPRRTDPAPLHVPTITMVGGPNDANNSSTFRGRVSRRGGHTSQGTGPIDSSTTTRTSKRSTPPSLNDTRTKKKLSKKKPSHNSPVTVDSKKSLPPADWNLIRGVTLPRKDSSDPMSSFGLGVRPSQGLERGVLVRSDYTPTQPSKNSAATLKPCEFPKKGDIVVAVNGQTVFDIGTMDVCSGFSMRPVAELMRNTEDGKPLQLDLLRPSTDDASNSAAMSAVPERSRNGASAIKTSVVADSSGRSLPQKDVEVLKKDDTGNADDDVTLWKGAEEFLIATCEDAKAAITGAISKHDEAISAAPTSVEKEKDAVAIMAAEHNKFVDAVNNALAQNRREVDLGLAKLRDEASRYREATLNRNREAARYRTFVAGAGGQDEAVAQRVAVLDKAIEEKRQAKREYQCLIAAVGDKETMVQVIEERRRQLDAALVQSRASLGATAAMGKTNETPGAHSAGSTVEKNS